MNNIKTKVYKKLLKEVCEKYDTVDNLLMTELKRFALMKSYLLKR